MKLMQKKIVAIIVITLFSMMICSAGTFEHIFGAEFWNYEYNSLSVGKLFKQYFNNYTHFPVSATPYIVADKYGGKKNYTEFMTGIKVDSKWSFWGEIMWSQSQYGAPYEKFVNEAGFLLINVPFSGEPVFKEYHPKTDLAAWTGGTADANELTGFAVVPAFELGDTAFYYYTNPFALHKESVALNKELLGKYPFPNNFRILPGNKRNSIIYTGDYVWILFSTATTTSFASFNTNTEEWIVYDSTNLPLPLGRPFNADDNFNTFNLHVSGWCMDFAAVSPKPIMVVTENRVIDNNCTANSYILYYNHSLNKWDTFHINPESEFWIKNGSMLGSKIFPLYDMGYNKYAITFGLRRTSLGEEPWPHEMYLNNRAFMILDLENKSIEFIAPPIEVFTDLPVMGSMYTLNIRHIDRYVGPNNKPGLGILYSTGDFIQYIDGVGIVDNTEAGSIPDLWFRYLYPNPTAPNSHVTANIMCYLTDISKVELGLYDFMGQKILDLSNQFEYSEATHTISATFTMPEKLSRGIYFLNVRKGTETHTKSIIVVGE